MTKPLDYFVIDAFTDRPFSGNPAAVVALSEWRDEAWLSSVAAEMNLSETAFFVPTPAGFDLRWFTPTIEVDLCGHATLATAIAITEMQLVAENEEICFSTKSGMLKARCHGKRVTLDFPICKVTEADPPDELISALGVTPTYIGKSSFDYLVEAGSEAEVRSLTPDFARLSTVTCRGVIVTARSTDSQFDFVSRFFAPASGVDEDPVTGSAHCCLADFWRTRIGKETFHAIQVSDRGGIIDVKIHQDRVFLSGQGVIVAQGTLQIT